MIDTNLNPTDKQVRSFGLMMFAFVALLGALAWWRGQAFIGVAIFLGACVLVSAAFNYKRIAGQLPGFILPAVCLAIGLPVRLGAQPMAVAIAVWAVGALVASLITASPAIGKRVYIGWMLAAVPVGWTISHLLIVTTYYLVITPLGLIMRLFGWDPLQRKLDPNATTYWQPRQPVTDQARYFKQF